MHFLSSPRALAIILISGVSPVFAQDISVGDVSAYYCRQLDGAPSGSQCTAPYKPYSGNACSVYEGVDDKSGAVAQWFKGATATCSAANVADAKRRTLKARADLRGYVSLGHDESVNDPVVNQSYRPDGRANSGAGERYFAAECAVRTCGGGGSGTGERVTKGTDDDDDDTPAPPPVQPRRAAPPPAASPNSRYFALTICNKTPRKIFVAYSSREAPESQEWYVAGWKNIPAETCENVGVYPKQAIYLHAQNDRNGAWSGQDIKLCVENERFKYVNFAGKTCQASLLRGFYKKTVTDDSFTWSLTD